MLSSQGALLLMLVEALLCTCTLKVDHIYHRAANQMIVSAPDESAVLAPSELDLLCPWQIFLFLRRDTQRWVDT